MTLKFDLTSVRIGIIGLGYVGLPLAVEFGKRIPVIGFDIKQARIDELNAGHDRTREVGPEELAQAKYLTCTADPERLRACNVFIVTVPTPVDNAKRPDLTPLIKASETVGKVMPKDAVVIYESTVYPGATEEVCIPLLEKHSGLIFNRDFFAGYSPERINPGDKEHRLPTIKKVTSGSTPETADFVDALYRSIITAGTHKASSIKVAEAAKVIENTQRDLNIALMNELALIFHRLGIDTKSVLDAAGTKWNFLKFFPGLVGGHCIGVDPYYLSFKAKALGYHPQMIDSGRFINDSMGRYIGKQTVKKIIASGKDLKGARVLIMGITFKEDVTDIRNSKVIDIIKELDDFGISVDVIDPGAGKNEVKKEYHIDLKSHTAGKYDAVIVAVSHKEYLNLDESFFASLVNEDGIVVDVKGIFRGKINNHTYWSL